MRAPVVMVLAGVLAACSGGDDAAPPSVDEPVATSTPVSPEPAGDTSASAAPSTGPPSTGAPSTDAATTDAPATTMATGPSGEELMQAIEGPLVTADGTVATLTDRMAQLQVPGLALAVVRDGEVVLTTAFGTTPEGDAPITADTLFQVGSVSKLVAATGAMTLVADGTLGFDTDLAPALRSWTLPPGAQTADDPVTVAGILSHTAGLNAVDFLGYGPDEPVPDLPAILRGEGATPAMFVETAPGGGFAYSGGAYEVLEQAMVDVTGQPFEALMRERVFEPAGMASSRYDHPLAADAAAGATSGTVNGEAMAGRFRSHPEHAAAGLWTTAADLGRFAAALGRSLSGDDEALLPAEWSRRMVEPATSYVGRDGTTSFVGSGTFLDTEQPSWFGHGGRNIGFCSENAMSVDGRHGVVVLTNGLPGGTQLADELIDTIAAAAGWPDWPGSAVL